MMDNRGFIFTTDAVLALVVVLVLTASVVAYQFIPQYMGDDHQHLEAMADSALNVMYQDGTLYSAAGFYANGNNTQAQNSLSAELNTLLPDNVGYRITIDKYPSVENDRGLATSNDVVTKVKVISGPKEGWMGRAWYKIDEVNFTDRPQNVTTTLWNFHNWLTNYDPWGGNWGGLNNYNYWGYNYGGPQSISFSIPANATINNALFLLGSASSKSKGKSYGANVVLNSIHQHLVSSSSFTFLSYRSGTTSPTYNYQGVIDKSELVTGNNNYYVNFINASSSNDMPWFSIIGNYTTTLPIPQGIDTIQTPFNNAAGLAIPATYDRWGNPSGQDLDGDGKKNEYGRIYNLNTGNVTNLLTPRSISWSDLLNKNHGFDDGVPFVITDIPNIGSGSAVSIVQNVNVPQGVTIFDGYVVVNAYGAVDNVLVEVWDGSKWNTAFNSFDTGGTEYSDRSDGYGNIPGIIYIGNYLKNGNNKVRITAWDQVGSTDYDLAGLVNCYSSVTYTRLPINWITSQFHDPYNSQIHSYQSNNNQYSQTSSFTVGRDAQKVLLFLGVGANTRHLRIDFNNNTVLYDSDTVPFYLDLGKIDAGGPQVFTSGNSGNYTLKQGTYNLRVTVTASNSWESGDGASNPGSLSNAEIFSGTRVAVLYPKFLRNLWTTAYADNAQDAETNAVSNLKDILDSSIGKGNYDPAQINATAMYTGDLPNALPVRLELWEK